MTNSCLHLSCRGSSDCGERQDPMTISDELKGKDPTLFIYNGPWQTAPTRWELKSPGGLDVGQTRYRPITWTELSLTSHLVQELF